MMDDPVTPSEVRQHLRSGISFPADLSWEELIRDWTLTETDLVQVRICRGEDSQRRFALQLCTLRRYRRFLETYDDSPLQIVNHLSAQLELPPVLFVAPSRPNTESEHRSRLLAYLELRELDLSARQTLALWIEEQIKAGFVPHRIAAQAEPSFVAGAACYREQLSFRAWCTPIAGGRKPPCSPPLRNRFLPGAGRTWRNCSVFPRVTNVPFFFTGGSTHPEARRKPFRLICSITKQLGEPPGASPAYGASVKLWLVSTSMAGHFRVYWSTSVKARNFCPLLKLSLTKCMAQC
jgi:hypothetical protein